MLLGQLTGPSSNTSSVRALSLNLEDGLEPLLDELMRLGEEAAEVGREQGWVDWGTMP